MKSSKSLWLTWIGGLLLGCQSGWQPNGSHPGTAQNTTNTPPLLDGNFPGIQPSDPWNAYPGDMVNLQVVDSRAWQEFAHIPLSWASDIKLYVHLVETEPNCWDGWVMVGYGDPNQRRWAYFTSKHPQGRDRVRVSYRNWYNGYRTCAFNQFFEYNGKRVFHGFFQDAYGAVVLVFDDIVDTNDGLGAQFSGQLFFKNFRQAPAPQFANAEGEQCWFLLPPSPYECGTFKVGEKVNTTSRLYPEDGYQSLGYFSGLRSRRALGR